MTVRCLSECRKVCIKKNVRMMNGGGSVYGEVISSNETDYVRAFR